VYSNSATLLIEAITNFKVQGRLPLSQIGRIKQEKQALIRRFAQANDVAGALQVITVIAPLVLLWWVAIENFSSSWWLTAAAIVAISFFNLRVFSLMHECGHGALFRTQALNRAAGFLFGVLSGMPQYVWAQHHAYHHRHNGNWEKYRGPLSTLSIDEYEALSFAQQRRYRRMRHIALAPLGGLGYLIINPRINWVKGTLALIWHLLAGQRRGNQSLVQRIASFETRYWKSIREYQHMFWNNVVLLSVWAVMAVVFGALPFFTIYLISLSFAGGGGIMLFTLQHNFEHSYAADTDAWDHDEGAIAGTSFLVLPAWLNWFTANIGYHHVHHLSSAIPNYRLVEAHESYAALFTDVPRLRLAQVPYALTCILWDRQAKRIISFAEYDRRKAMVKT
jgi:omega-6 fatty acid desaturase (delta-12 desaturase)